MERREREALDRHITGNYGEDQFKGEAEAEALAEKVGNSFGFLCPKCKRGDHLAVGAHVTVRLTPDGSEDSGGAHEWDKDSEAMCNSCNWFGRVGELERAEGFDA